MRPTFNTGNLQQIPSRGKLAKIIKRMFVADKGYMLIRFDYSAHEVRVWSIASGDKVLADSFKIGQKLRQEFIQTLPIPEKDTKLKKYFEEWLNYDAETGDFTWKKSPNRAHPVGSKAGNKQPDGWTITIEGKVYRAHRTAFLMHYGYLPEEVDHKNNDPFDNCLKNLRPATRSENAHNVRRHSDKAASKYKGVHKGTRDGSWVAQIRPSPDQKTLHLGVFDSEEDAHAAYVEAAKKYHGRFGNDGKHSIEQDDGDYRHPSMKAKDAIKKRGDLHILNVLRFFGKLVDKDHPLRDAVKAVVFGVLYGKSAETLGVDTKKGDMDALKGKISALYDESLKQDTPKERIAEINQMLEELDGKLTALIAEDRTKYAQSIIDKMFAEFKMGAAWTHKMQELAEKEFYVYSPIGRRRFLPAAMTGTRQIIAQQVRRGSNAPIQGFASEIGIKASRLIMEEYYRHLPRFKQFLKLEDSNWSLRAKYNRVVHDANYFAVPYEMVLPFIHISQYMATYGVTKAYKDQFNLDFTVEPEIELELGAQDANSHKWDWSLPNLMEALKNTLKESEELDLLDGTKEEILDAIVYPWKNKKFRAYLQENFPLLNVKNLDQQIDDALEKATWTT